MSKIKLRTAHAYKANQTNVLPYVGVVTFDEQGIIEVEEQHVESLIDVMPEFSLHEEEKPVIVPEPIKPKVEENDLGKGDDTNKIAPQTQEADILGATETTTVKADGAAPVVETKEESKEENTTTVEVVVEGDKVDSDTQSEETKSEVVKKTPEEIAEVLKTKTAAELKEILADFPKEETENLKNRDQYTEYLVVQLSK